MIQPTPVRGVRGVRYDVSLYRRSAGARVTALPRSAQPRLVPWRLAWVLVLGPGGGMRAAPAPRRCGPQGARGHVRARRPAWTARAPGVLQHRSLPLSLSLCLSLASSLARSLARARARARSLTVHTLSDCACARVRACQVADVLVSKGASKDTMLCFASLQLCTVASLLRRRRSRRRRVGRSERLAFRLVDLWSGSLPPLLSPCFLHPRPLACSAWRVKN